MFGLEEVAHPWLLVALLVGWLALIMLLCSLGDGRR
jgi:hypothetical protein